MKAVVTRGTAKGEIMAPPSKSMAHRYMICAALSSGVSVIDNINYSEDVLATIDCIRALGATVEEQEDKLVITADGRLADGLLRLNCRECGSTLRFMVPLAMSRSDDSILTGSETLMTRPMSVYENIAASQDITYLKEGNEIRVGGILFPGSYFVPGNISSQFISGLLFALPRLTADSSICLIPPVDSRSYIDLTINALRLFGIRISWQDENTIFIEGNQQYKPANVTVEGDYSNAAFLEVFNTLGGEVDVKGLDETSDQGDRVYLDYFKQLCEGRASLDISNCPDLGPVLFTVAATHFGGDFTGTKRLAIKESNRGLVMCEELAKFGIKTLMEEDAIHIEPGELKAPEETLKGHNDHRIVMSLVTLLTLTGGEVDDATAVNKSFPDYYDRVRRIGIDVKVSE